MAAEPSDSTSEAQAVVPDPLTTVLSKSARRRLDKLLAHPTYGETPEQTQTRRTQRIKELALGVGFSRVGIAQVEPLSRDTAALQRWVDAGMHGQMAWMAVELARRCDPTQVVDGAQSVVVLALDYDSDAPRTHQVDLHRQADPASQRGWISRYAWGDDYHLVAEKMLRRLEVQVSDFLRPEVGENFRPASCRKGSWKSVRDFRWYVDHGPVLERAWAERAGIGWRGKHSLIIHPRHGSFFFLACIVTSLALDPDPPLTDHCGTCTACLDACPTQAIVAPYTVDARKCISHTTIEIEGTIPDADRHLPGNMLFGCDICQDVCPWNRFSQPSPYPGFAPRPGNLAPLLAELEALDETGFAERFARSPLKRRGLAGLQDNARAVRGLPAQTASDAPTDA